MKTKIVVSRKWQEPEIELFVNQTEVGAKMSLNDFKLAVHAHIGSPALLMTKAQMLTALDAAITAVVTEMKDNTKHIV
jgi:hypothetical protein